MRKRRTNQIRNLLRWAAILERIINEETRHKPVWGWLRLFLALAQMGMVAAAFGALITVGVQRITVVFVIMATTFTIMSRIIDRGRRTDPWLDKENHDK